MASGSARDDDGAHGPLAAWRAAREHHRRAAEAAGWHVVTVRDIPGLAWSRALFGMPRRWGQGPHLAAAVLSWPGLMVAVLVLRRGWYHRQDRQLVVRLVRRRPTFTVRLFAISIAVLAAAQIVARLVRVVLGDALVWMAAGLWVYAIVVGVLMWVGRRERRPKAERDGLTRTPAAEHGDWALERVEHRVGVDDGALRAVRELIDGLVPPGESVGAAPASNAEEGELRSIGFDQGPGSWGNLLLERSASPPR